MSRAPEKIGRLFTLYMRLDLETILITVKNSILLGNTNTFEINSFSYGGVSYPTEDALSKIEEIRNYVNDTVDEVLKEILNQLPNCISNGQRIQEIHYKQVYSEHEGKTCVEYISFFIDAPNDISDLPSEIIVYAFRGKGTFDKAVSYINMMSQNDIPVTVGTVLQKSNLSRLDSLINFLKKLDVKMIHFFPLYLKGRGKSQMKLGIDETDRLIIKNKLENDYKNNHCSRTPFCINGTAYFKVLNTGECVIQKGREKLVLGSLYESSFADLYRKAVEMLKPEIVSCKNCKYYDDPMLCENMHIYCMDDLNFR